MLTTIGQGVVLNALIADGFVPSYYHFDIVRLFKRNADGSTLTAEVTTEVDFGNWKNLIYSPSPAPEDAIDSLPEALCSAAQNLIGSANCCHVANFSWQTAEVGANLERIDRVNMGSPSQGPAPTFYQSVSTKTRVRLRQH